MEISEGEHITVKSFKKHGIIKVIRAHSVEVDLETGEGIVNVPWTNL
jgi:hypothetical protein